MAPRQKYGQDRGHVAVSGPMRGQHCRGLDQSQPRVTGTWVWCDKLLCDSIAVRLSYPRVSERERETGPWVARQAALSSQPQVLEPGLSWAGPAPGTRVL